MTSEGPEATGHLHKVLARAGSTSRSLSLPGQGWAAMMQPCRRSPQLCCSPLQTHHTSFRATYPHCPSTSPPVLLTSPPDVVLINGCVQGQNSSVTSSSGSSVSILQRQSLKLWCHLGEMCSTQQAVQGGRPAQIMWQK